MKTYLASILSKIKNLSLRLDEKSSLIDKAWVKIDPEDKIVYFFKEKNKLLISKNGRVTKGRWEFIDFNRIIIDFNNDSFLLNHGFLDKSILILQVDGANDFLAFFNPNGDESFKSLNDVVGYIENEYAKGITISNESDDSSIKTIENNNLEEPQVGRITTSKIYLSSKLGKCKKHTILFMDGLNGTIYESPKLECSFFYDKNYDSYYYKDKESCIFAFYHFLKSQVIIEKNRIIQK